MLALALLLVAQDLSTPDRALTSYSEARDSLVASWNLLESIAKIELEVEGSLASEARKRRLEAQLGPAKAAGGAPRVVSRQVVERTEDGRSATLVISEKVRLTRHDAKTGRPSEVEDTRSKRLVFARVGDRWLVSEEYDPCGTCSGRGTCNWCGGKGQVNNKECPPCKGSKACRDCKGARWQRRTFEGGVAQIGVLEGFQPRTDVSKPQAAAEAYADALIVREIRAAQTLQRFFEESIDILRAHFVEGTAAEARKALDEALERGKRALTAASPPRVGDVKEAADGTATAVVSVPPSVLGPSRLRRISLVQSGERWLVDGVSDACPNCNGSGVCPSCKAKSQILECVYCRKSGKCSPCAGAGFEARP